MLTLRSLYLVLQKRPTTNPSHASRSRLCLFPVLCLQNPSFSTLIPIQFPSAVRPNQTACQRSKLQIFPVHSLSVTMPPTLLVSYLTTDGTTPFTSRPLNVHRVQLLPLLVAQRSLLLRPSQVVIMSLQVLQAPTLPPFHPTSAFPPTDLHSLPLFSIAQDVQPQTIRQRLRSLSS